MIQPNSLGETRDVPCAAPSPAAPELEQRHTTDPASTIDEADAPRRRSQPWRLPSRYQTQGAIARGGMGLVLRVHDVAIDRTLALKLLLDFDPAATARNHRFLDEARITGQLQHPGIPPVHEIGQLDDGRPFFSMKLIAGRTLAELLHERPAPHSELPRFLHIFEQIAQTVAYAHAQGVIHRDLKPHNIMVGAFGEVQVMDWGLAKRLHSGSAAAPIPTVEAAPPSLPSEGETVAYRPDASDDRTQAGQVMGTLAYMPPEQARGEVERLDERSDVFGLGAILCQILTGEPPYRAASQEDLWRQAQLGDLAPALGQLEACGVETELIVLARRYLAAEPEDRPQNAGVVAEQITAHLQSVQQRLQQAERERAVAAARAVEERKRRRWQLALMGSLLLLALLGAGGGLWLQQQQERLQRQEDAQRADRQRQEQAIDAGLEEMHSLMKKFRWDEARAVLTQAKSRLGEDAPAELQQRLRQAENDLDLAAGLDRIRSDTATILGDSYDHAGLDGQYAALFEKAGLLRVGEDAESVAARLRASAIHSYLVAALDHWTLHCQLSQPDGSRWRWLLAITRQADPDPWRDRFRDPSIRRDPSALKRLAGQAPIDGLPPQTLIALAQLLGGREVQKLLRAAQPLHRDDFWLNFELGNALAGTRPNEAEAYYLAALALHPRSYAVLVNLGNVLATQGRKDEAIAVFRKAIEINDRFASAYINLGNALHARGQKDDALALLRKALEINPQSDTAYNNLGLVFLDTGKLDEAVAAFNSSIQVNPNATEPHYNLSRALMRQKKVDQAIAALRRTIQIDPQDARDIHYRPLVHLLLTRGDFEEAVTVLRRYVARGPQFPSVTDRRFSAALALIGAIQGSGVQAVGLDESRRGQLRQQARDWLADSLRIYRQQIEGGNIEMMVMIELYLSQWQHDAKLRSVREAAELAKLPEMERQLWQRLWSEVNELAQAIRARNRNQG